MNILLEELKEFWEWCNLTVDYSERWNCHYLYSPAGREICSLGTSLNLNNLFEIAVPKLFAYDIHAIWRTPDLVSELSEAIVWLSTWEDYTATNKDPAFALYYAIQKARGKGI